MASRRLKSQKDSFRALQEILSAAEQISDIVYKVSQDPAIRKQIDEHVSTIAERCVELSEKIQD